MGLQSGPTGCPLAICPALKSTFAQKALSQTGLLLDHHDPDQPDNVSIKSGDGQGEKGKMGPAWGDLAAGEGQAFTMVAFNQGRLQHA